MAAEGAVEVLVRPRASREEVAGEHDGAVVVRLTAPPAEGRANRALLKLVAARCGVPASRARIVRGASARRKLIAVAGLDSAELRRRLLA